MLYSLSDDVESQRKGIIVVCWTGSNTSITSLPTQADIALIKRMHEGTPIRTCSVHFCLPDKPYLHAMRAMIAMSLGDARSRLRFHIGMSHVIVHHRSSIIITTLFRNCSVIFYLYRIQTNYSFLFVFSLFFCYVFHANNRGRRRAAI